MKKNNVTIKYDSDADVLSMASEARANIDHAQEMGNVVVHFSKKGEPVVVEILEASELFRHQSPSLKQSIRRALVAV